MQIRSTMQVIVSAALDVLLYEGVVPPGDGGATRRGVDEAMLLEDAVQR